MPPLRLEVDKRGFVATAAYEWLHNSPLTAAALQDEEQQWARLGKNFRLKIERSARSLATS